MYCGLCDSAPCTCRENVFIPTEYFNSADLDKIKNPLAQTATIPLIEQKPLIPIKRECLRCGGTGWVKEIVRNDQFDPGSYDGPCLSCGGR